MDHISDIQAFVKIAELGSFSSAAKELRMPKSTLSRRITRHEDRLGVQLFVRTTRKVTLTEMGEVYYRHCQQIVADIEEAEDAIRQSQSVPSGTLKVTGPSFNGGQFMARLTADFLKTYPDVRLEMTLTNRYVNLIDEGFDVALRGGVLKDSTLVARRLSAVRIVLIASPEYLARRGTPKRPEDLTKHDCLVLDNPGADRRWPTLHGGSVAVSGPLLVNDLDILRQAALKGLGIARIPENVVIQDIKEGRLQLLLDEQMSGENGLYVLYPPNRYLAAKVRAFVDFAVEYFKREDELLQRYEEPPHTQD